MSLLMVPSSSKCIQ